MSNRYDTNTQNTSKYMQDMINEFNKMPRGAFDLTRRKIFDIGMYDIVPIECWEMLPNSEAYVSYDIQMLTKNPTIKKLLSSMRVELRVYKGNYNDFWNGWNNFITKGRSGKVSKSIPQLDWTLGTSNLSTSLPYNPAFYLNLAPPVYVSRQDIFSRSKNTGVINKTTEATFSNMTATSISDINQSIKISALPFVMYNKIAKKYLSPNLLQDNPYWFPENEDHDMYLPYDCPALVTTSDYYNPDFKAVNGVSTFTPNQQKTEGGEFTSHPWLNVLWKSQRKGDYFNTGSPFPDLIRGDTPTIQALNVNADIDWTDVLANSQSSQGSITSTSLDLDNLSNILNLSGNLSIDKTKRQLGLLLTQIDSVQNKLNIGINSSEELKEALNKAHVNVRGIEFSMRQWRQLATMTVMRERMALTDGSYNELIKSMFGHNPQWHNHDVVYCGGDTQPIVFSEVINTAASDANPLGETGGRAFTSQSGKTIHIKSDDFGMFMTVLVITGDDVYSQGIDRMFSRLENSEQYFPILNNLSPDATLNKELYVSGDTAVDNDVFNYQERFAYYKSRQNQVSGLMALPIAKVGDIGAYLQNRLFSSTPKFNQEFSYGELTDNEKLLFTSTDQAEFVAVVGSQMKYIAPIPEDSRPSDMGISY